jgi:hypothetical protein
MNTLKSTFLILLLLVSAIAIGHAAQPADIERPSQSVRAEPSASELQSRIETYTRSIFDHDVRGFSGVVSSEVLAWVAKRGIDLPTFLEKEHNAIVRTFGLAVQERPIFEVAEALPMGDTVRVNLRFHGEELPKPFYFTRENGALKINIAPPGFSRAAPRGVLFGSHNYTVHNVNIIGNQPFTLQCYQGNNVFKHITVAAQSTNKISCEDACGRWWSGTIFADFAGNSKHCDWNWWGDDVRINLLAQGGWECNDPC